MSSTVTVTVHSCPPGQVRAVLDVVDAWQLTDSRRPADDWITLGYDYQSNSAAGLAATEIHDRLLRAAPDAVWTVVEDATAEWLGDVFTYVPALGTWTAHAGPDGSPVYTPDQVATLAGAPPTAVAALLGTAWSDAVAAFRTGEEVEVVVPPPFEVTWARTDGRIDIDAAGDADTDLELPRIPAQPRRSAVVTDPADEALRAAGFIRASVWSDTSSGRVQHTTVYRLADAYPNPATSPGA